MQLSRKRLLISWTAIAVLLMVAFCLRFVLHAHTTDAVHGILMMTVRWVIHITLTVCWCVSIHRRMLSSSIRRMLLSVGGLLLLWQLVRIIKYDYVIITQAVGRYCWYGFYIPMVLVPLIGVFIIDHIGKPEGYRSPGWMKYLFIPAVFLIAVVFTNDLHQLVFVFHEGFALYNSVYGYDFMYIGVMAWFVLLGLYFVLMLLKKSRVPGSKSFQKLPLMVMLGAIVFWVGYSMKLYEVDLTAIDCLIIILLLESAIQSGLIASNMNYEELFRQSALPVQIIDEQYRVCYSSEAAQPLMRSQIEKARQEAVELGDTILHGQPVSGGWVLWQNDVKDIRELTEHLQEANELLSQRYDLMKAEVALRERRLHAEEKSRLYDRIAREIAPRLDRADALLRQSREHPEKADALLLQICVISAYIKRRANLVLLGEEKATVASRELESCLRESMDNLRLSGVLTCLDSRCEATASIRQIVAAYDFFEDVAELLLDGLNALIVTVCCDGRTIGLRMQGGLCGALPPLDTLRMEQGSFTVEVNDEDVFIEAVLPQGGVSA